MPKGHCHLCGNLSELSFDHVPPRAAFNKRTRYQEIPILKYLKVHNPFKEKQRGKIQQGGIGYYSLCRSCNSFIGLNYTPDYVKYSNSFIEFVKKDGFNHFEFEMHSFTALNVLKQTVAMFISLNSWEFLENHPDLRNFVSEIDNNILPDRYRFFIYLNNEGQLRNSPIVAVGDLKSGKSILASEISFPPLGHVMTLDFSGSLPLHFEITNFRIYNRDALPSIVFKVNKLATYLPFPLDYRPISIIEQSINRTKNE